jgi:hypothetical protein
VKQSRRDHHHHTPPLSPNPYQLIAADNEKEAEEGGQEEERGRAEVSITAASVSVPKGGGGGRLDSKTSRRRKRRKNREKAVVQSVRESLQCGPGASLQSVQHENSELIILRGTVDGVSCRDVLVDAGASSNFVRRDWVLSQRLPVQEINPPVRIKMADDRVIYQTGAVVAKSVRVNGSFAPCILLVMDRLSHNIILGMPWLKKARVTLGCGEVLKWNGKPLYRLKTNGDPSPQLQSVKTSSGYEGRLAPILQQYQTVFAKELPRKTSGSMKNAIHYKIQLKDPHCRPIAQRERRRSPKDVQTLIDAVKEMEAAGLITDSDSPWSSQAVLVAKKRDGVVLAEKRPCWDYRGVNEVTISDAYPLPLPEQMFDQLKGCRLFSKMDLLKGFWQIPLEKETQRVLAFSTPLGLKQPLFMPFGIKNAPAAFQREMQRVLREKLYKGVMVFVDDILIYTQSEEEHAELVEWVLRRLQEEGYYAHPEKCEFFQSEVSFLGHVVSEKGVAVQQYKVKSVQEWPTPASRRDVRSFLGLTGYYRKFVPQYSEIALPLTDLTKDNRKFEWTEKEQTAFQQLKDRLTTADVLAHPDPSRQYIINTDASGFAISGVLSQEQADGTVRPVAYWSRKMNGACHVLSIRCDRLSYRSLSEGPIETLYHTLS